MIKPQILYTDAFSKEVHFHIDRFLMRIEIDHFVNGRFQSESSYSDETFMLSDFATWVRESVEND